MPCTRTCIPSRCSSNPSPVQENNFNIDHFTHTCGDRSRPYPTLGNVLDRSATADPTERFTDIGFRDFIQASWRVSWCKLACIETTPYASELLGCGIDFVTGVNRTFNSVLDTSVVHMSNVGVMLMDEIARVNERVDGCHKEIEKLKKDCLGFQEWTLKTEDEQEQQGMAIDWLKVITLKDLVQSLIDQTGRLEDDRVRLTHCVSELTGEVRDLQRRCQGEEFDPHAEFVPNSEPNSDTELPDYEDLSDMDPNEIREQNWVNEELVRNTLEIVQRIRRDVD
ncbi:hypothetical protein BJ322DRAFT_1113185 [Thelephora terrestris]|uniref:Uncharacterized protein n=1 Tax=Thelephora terrestris TaxID=56493 RepID=A0A9P6L2Y6_9AGAM|nr:hypothetical protein BJ322DRAFT_1113185 [Thelephora terrestris]